MSSSLAPRITGQLVEVGCGNKPRLSLYRAEEYVGSEVESLQNPEAKAVAQYYDGERLLFEQGSFDSVVLNQVFMYVSDPE